MPTPPMINNMPASPSISEGIITIQTILLKNCLSFFHPTFVIPIPDLYSEGGNRHTPAKDQK